MANQKSFFDRYSNWVKTSIGLKVATIVFLVLILLIPVSMIESLIREREIYQERAIDEVSEKWGQDQTVTALVLTVPYYIYSRVKDKDGGEQIVKHKHFAHFLPSTLNMNGRLHPEKRYRGIYEVVLYKCNLNISGSFDKPDFEKLNINPKHVEWEQSYIELGLSDLRSIQNNISISWNNSDVSFDPGVKNTDVIASGISTKILTHDSISTYSFTLDMHFNGSDEISFTPLGKTTNVQVSSQWADPSFNGAFLPDTREISDSNFVAYWEVLHLNRNYPQEFTGPMNRTSDSNFGVGLIMPVDQYQKSMRSVKYAIMFISLTFLVYFFSQIKNKVRVHPIQYLIVGLAICLFFTLLIALSEHLNFGIAYLIGAVGTISMISSYSSFIFKNPTLTKILAGILIVLYGFIYIIIQLQDYSLLIGSIGLFVILGTVMYLSRNIDWYNTTKDK